MKSGLTSSEVGLIPESWEVARLEVISDRIMVGIASAATHAYCASGVPLLRNQNIKAGFLDDRDLLHVTPAYEETFRNKRLRAGDLLTARTGHPGLTCVVPATYEAAQSFTTLITRPKRDVVDSQFLCQFVNSSIGQAFFERSQIGGAQKNVNAGTLRGMPVPVPPLHEQSAIAAALSDVDALLGALNRLVVKKRDLKQAAMQQLLTGQTRLPGFSGKWQSRRLGDLLTVRHGKNQNEAVSVDGRYPVLATGGEIARASRFLHDKPSVLIGRKGTIDRPQYMDTPFWTVDTLFYTVVHLPNDAKFLFYRFCLIDWNQYNEASGVPSLNARTIEAIRIDSASGQEQTAIAEVLSDMDAEITALEARRDKTRLLKQGMMQELLTGRTRLV